MDTDHIGKHNLDLTNRVLNSGGVLILGGLVSEFECIWAKFFSLMQRNSKYDDQIQNSMRNRFQFFFFKMSHTMEKCGF